MTPVATVRWRLAAGLAWAAVAPLSALAAPPSIADPTVFVPPARYRSVFVDTPTGVEQGSTDWVKANATVGPGHPSPTDLPQPAATPPSPPTAAPAPGAVPPAHTHHH